MCKELSHASIPVESSRLISEAGAGGASTYQVGNAGALELVSSIVMTGQRAACWTVATKNGRYAYVTNNEH
jgi:hypothetical protein